MTFFKIKPDFAKLHAAVQFTSIRSQTCIKNVVNCSFSCHCTLNSSVCFFKFNLKLSQPREIWKRGLLQLSGLATCHQKAPFVGLLKEQIHWTNSPRGFYMQSPKFATITYDLLSEIEASTTDDKTADRPTTTYFCLPLCASEDDFLKSVKQLNTLPKSNVQDICNCNLGFVTQGIKSIGTLTEEVALKEYLRFFTKVDITQAQRELRTFEQKCVDHMEAWPVDTVLLVSDAFYLIGHRAQLFNKKMYEYIGKRIHSLSRYNIVQLAYLIGENRNVPSTLMSQVQKRMLNFKDEFTVSEIGAICNGFFKSQNRITSTEILTSFAKRLMLEDTRAIDSHSLVGILKMYRYAYFGSEVLFSKMANEIVQRIPKMRIEPVTHVALTYSTLRMFHAPLMDAIAEVYVNRIKHGRCKDVTKCLWAISTLAHQPPNVNQFYKTALYEIRRRLAEYTEHPNHLTSGLLALAYMNIYPLDVIDYSFNTTFLDSVKNYRQNSGMDLRPDLHLLDSALAIDRPLYCGNRFPTELLKEGKLPDDFYANFDEELNKRQFLKPVISCLSEILGDPQVVKTHFILQHMKTLDVEVRLSESGKPIPFANWDVQDERTGKTSYTASTIVQQIMQGRPLEETSLRPDHRSKSAEASSTRIAIVLWSRNHFRFGAKQHIASRCLLGLHAMKRRHLLLLGYKIVELPFYELEDVVGKGNSALTQYLRQKLLQLPQMRTLLQDRS